MHGDEGWLLFDGVEMPCQVVITIVGWLQLRISRKLN